MLYTSARAGTSSTVDGAAGRGPAAAVRRRSSTHVPPPRGDADGAAADARREPRLERLPRAHRDRPHLQRPRQGRRPGRRLQARRHVPRHQGHEAVRLRRAASASTSTRRPPATSSASPGIEDITIGETIADVEHRMAIPPIAVDEPTVSMIFGVNTSPMAGRDGQFVTSRQIKDRLDRELLGNVSIRVEPTDTPEQMKVLGRGELQLSILIEMMRREGFELQVSRPDIVTKERQRQGDGAGRGPGDRRRRGVPGRRHRAGRHAPRDDDEDGQPRQRPRAPRVPHPGARPDRVPLAVPDRDQGHRDHEPPVRRLGAVARRDPGARDRRARRRPRRRRDRLRDLEPAGARRDLHRARPTRSTRG